jgi:hypothetical protein
VSWRHGPALAKRPCAARDLPALVTEGRPAGNFGDGRMRSDPVAQQDRSASPVRGGLSVSQQRLWILERLHPRNPAHNVSYDVRLTGLLDAENFKRAWHAYLRERLLLR